MKFKEGDYIRDLTDNEIHLVTFVGDKMYEINNACVMYYEEVEKDFELATRKDYLLAKVDEYKTKIDEYKKEIEELEPFITDEDKEKIKKMLLLLDKSIDLKNVTASIDKYTSHYLIKLYSKESNSVGNSEASINVYHSYIGKMKDNHGYTLEELGIEVE